MIISQPIGLEKPSQILGGRKILVGAKLSFCYGLDNLGCNK